MSASGNVIERALPRPVPSFLMTVLSAMTAGGIVAFIVAVRMDPQTAWLAFHVNFVYFATLSQAGLIISCIFSIVGAKWPGVLRRFAEGLGAWIPISFVLFLISWASGSGQYLFEWYGGHAVHGKEAWLNESRVYLTDGIILFLLTILSLYFMKISVRPTLSGLASSSSGWAKSMAESWTAGWKGDEEERAEADRKKQTIAPLICLIFGIGYSFVAFDQVMSMEQTWYSNLFGAFVTWGGILSAVASIALLSVLHRNSPGIGEEITTSRLHDIGKLLFAFSIFWMYLFFSQYLVIWYGNLPEETVFFRDRLGDQFVIDKGFSEAAWDRAWSSWDFDWARLSTAYGWLAMVVWACCWIIPFFVLLGQKPKKTPAILGPVAAIVLLGLWLERNLLIWPSVIKGDGLAWFGYFQLPIALGFFGAFGLVLLIYTRVFPALAVPEQK